MATAGMAARKARALGPEAKSAKAAKRWKVIQHFAAKLRSKDPRYKGDASNTAATIVNDVNRVCAERNLLPAGSGRLSVKTIADHLRKGNGGKRLRTG
jgi:hypothetical protein